MSPEAPAPVDEAAADAWDGALPRGAHLLQSYRWGELQSRFGWTVERVQLDVDGTLVPVSLLVADTLAPGGRYAYVPRGPAVEAGQAPSALAALEGAARERDLAYLRVEPDLEAPLPPPEGWTDAPHMQPDHTAILDLRPSAEELLAGFKPKTRYNIRLAERKGVEVARSDDVAAFARLAAQTSARHRIQLAGEPYYRAVLDLLSGPDHARLYLASHEGEAIAGIIVTRFLGRAIYLFGASGRTGRNLMPAYLLHWRAILALKAAGDTEYDLWGTPPDDDPGHPWAGLLQFKSGWNGRPVAMAGAFDVPIKVTMWRADKALSRIRGNVRRVRSKLRGGGAQE
ncbi:MAG: hypothetical protein QOE92_2024 [Chloroflexota bacterium]|jgi:lipid II:glycine glycyltransferase (peptidoglycan interpeptide bridge formation enzyme)|nr:hypothetical protein [Chloroflexota bacterium]